MNEIYKALNWQGGTVRQIVAEIKKLQAIKAAAHAFGDEVAFADMIGQISKRNKGIAETGLTLSKLIN